MTNPVYSQFQVEYWNIFYVSLLGMIFWITLDYILLYLMCQYFWVNYTDLIAAKTWKSFFL